MIRLGQTIGKLRGARRYGLAFASGFAAALALPPLGAWPALFVVIPVFLLLLQTASGWRAASGLGWCFGFGYFIFAFHWIAYAFLVDAATYLWMMPFMVGGLAGLMAIYWGLAALATSLLRLEGLRLALVFAANIAIAEWLRGHLFTGFPWAVPGLAVDGMGAVAQVASLAGMTGLTLLIVMWAGLAIVLLVPSGWAARGMAVALGALLPLAWTYGANRLGDEAPAQAPGASIRIVQPNVAQDMKWRDENARGIFDSLQGLSIAPSQSRPRGLADVDYLLWPESAVPFLIDESPAAKTELKRLLQGHAVLMTGAIRREPIPGTSDFRVFNSIITFDGEAKVAARYDKWRLVPGGEFLPFEWLLEPLGFRKVVTVPGSFTAGPGPVTLALPGGLKAAMLVCYEVIFPHDLIDSGNRPDVIVNVTNDGWFGTSTGPYQHLAQARLRAIEQGLPAVRSANTGISAVIDSYGRITASLPLQVQGVIDAEIPGALGSTLYARWGDLAVLALAALAFGLAGSARIFRTGLQFRSSIEGIATLTGMKTIASRPHVYYPVHVHVTGAETRVSRGRSAMGIRPGANGLRAI